MIGGMTKKRNMSKLEFKTIHILFYEHGYTMEDIAYLMYRTFNIINAVLSVKEFSDMTDFNEINFGGKA